SPETLITMKSILLLSVALERAQQGLPLRARALEETYAFPRVDRNAQQRHLVFSPSPQPEWFCDCCAWSACNRDNRERLAVARIDAEFGQHDCGAYTNAAPLIATKSSEL